MDAIKLQVTLKPGSFLHNYFSSILKDRAEVARQKMELGIRAGSFEQVISQAFRDGLADLSVVAAAPTMSGDEDPAAAAATDQTLGGWFDEGDGD